MFYILDNFGISFVLDINSVLTEFICGIRDFRRDCFEKYSEGVRYFQIIFSLSGTLFQFFVNKY